jgi:type II secretion system protein H
MGESGEMMTSRITRRTSSGARLEASGGFTLVELLLVLALLSVVLAVGLPTLSQFFKGRTLDAEGRRLLALTRQAQSRAVNEGVPMHLWVDEQEKKYGLEAEPGWDERDPRAVEFKLDGDLKIELLQTNNLSVVGQAIQDLQTVQYQANRGTISEAQQRNLPQFRFLPDGSIAESSPSGAVLIDQQGSKLELRLARNRLNYELGRAEE